jgi:hypothetical protein
MAIPEKRKRKRSGYIHGQLVADYDGERLPQSDDFYSVKFMNISPTGAAFLCKDKPATDRLVMVLGKGDIYVVARIVRTYFRMDFWEPMYEIGCEFESRLR